MTHAEAPSSSPAQELDPSDPWAREAQTFPRLNDDMAGRIVRYGNEEAVAVHTFLFARGQRGVGEGSVVVQAVHRFLHPTPE